MILFIFWGLSRNSRGIGGVVGKCLRFEERRKIFVVLRCQKLWMMDITPWMEWKLGSIKIPEALIIG